MVAHFTMRTHGVYQAFRFVEGIWLHRKSHKIRFFFGKRPSNIKPCPNLTFDGVLFILIFEGTGLIMVFMLDGCSFHVAHVRCKQGLFAKKTDMMTLSM